VSVFYYFSTKKIFLLPKSRTSLIRADADVKQKSIRHFVFRALRAKLRFFFCSSIGRNVAIDYRCAGQRRSRVVI
jgi:hypothetical protein